MAFRKISNPKTVFNVSKKMGKKIHLPIHFLVEILKLARMQRMKSEDCIYTRLLNGIEGFTPPGLLFGLTYAWYLDNRFVDYVEYKMMLIRSEVSDLIPEQVRVLGYP